MFDESRGAKSPFHRDRYVHVQDIIVVIALAIPVNLSVSTRNLPAQLGVSGRSLQRITHDDINFFSKKFKQQVC